MTKIQVSKDAFLKINAFIKKDDSRYYLQGVYIQTAPTGTYLVATDGHALGVWQDECSGTIEGDSQIVRIDKTILDAIKKDKLATTLEITKNQVTCGDSTFSNSEGFFVDGTFPDWKRIIPKEAPKDIAQISFNPELLKPFSLNNKKSCLAFTFYSDTSPILIHNTQHAEFFGLVMPVKNTDQQHSYFTVDNKLAA